MTTVTSRKELKGMPDRYVYVQREEVMYTKVGDEWAMKLYFTSRDTANILNISINKVYDICAKIGIQAKANKNKKLKITLTQLQLIAKQAN